GLKSGVGLVLVLDGEQELNQVEVLVESADWSADVYVGDGDFGENGEDFDPDVAGGPVASLSGGDQASASLGGATGTHVLLWITEPGVLDDPERFNSSRAHRFVLQEAFVG
ncbi:MAG: hypothetical protein AAFO29_26565, partial [Actinomycetota bacterium]